jgi:PAS domain S-box-containing protein
MVDIDSERQRPEIFDELAHIVPALLFRADADGKWAYVNERWRHFTGRPPDTALGHGWLQAIDPDDRHRVRESWHRAVRHRQEFAEQFRFRTPMGSGSAAWARARPQIGPNRDLLGYVGAMCDISEQVRSEGMLQELAHTLGERIKELDCLYGISHIVERSGGSLDRILTETVLLLPPTWEHTDVTCARIVFRDRQFTTPNFAPSEWCQRADIYVHRQRVGHVRVCYLAPRPIRDEGPFSSSERQLLDSVALRLGHIAERFEAEALLGDRERELRERMTHLTRVGVMGEMASSIAHEVNQPLTAIATYAQACRRLLEAGDTTSDEVQSVLGRIGEEAIRAGGIIHRLKDLVRKRESRRAECDVNALVQDIEPLAKVDARLHDVNLELEFAPDLPSVLADGVQIQQVVLNLIRNGIDATGATPRGERLVVVRTATGAGDVEVCVEDNGCGMPDDAEELLFQPFYTTKEKGMGMGLSISRTIVTSHGGRMWFERKPVGGTAFHFTLPVLEEPEGHV